MPKSDTWPGGTGLETMAGMDSAGSCDSVVSANSGFSDDSMEHLSAEEKACLMFLEETIESLDTEEDSGLSNDESDQLPNSGNPDTKLVDLSASMGKSKLSSPQKHASEEFRKELAEKTKSIQNYLVPTPFTVANSSPCSVPSAVLCVPQNKKLSSKPHSTTPSKEPEHNPTPAAPKVPLEVKVVIPPPPAPRENSVKITDLNRGPLSYDALVHLRKSASTKKTPLCPTIDHTIELDKNLRVPVEESILPKLPRPDRSKSEAPVSSKAPPAVLPKPKKIPANISVKTQNEASIISDASYSLKHAKDPKLVRLEALQKLGLLKDEQPENETIGPLPASSLDQKTNRITRGPSAANPTRSPSFCYTQVPKEPKNKSLQSSASFHNHSRNDKQPVSASHTTTVKGLKEAAVERSASQENQRNSGKKHDPPNTKAKPVKTTNTAQPAPNKSSNSVPYTVMVVPGMGADRKEALRKLGLLKD